MAVAAATKLFRAAVFRPASLLPMDGVSFQIIHLCSQGHLSQALTALLSHQDHSPLHPNAVASFIHSCARRSLLSYGQAAHHHLLSTTPQSHLGLFVSNHLINLYSKCGRPELARSVFDEMPIRNLVSWTALLTGYAHGGLHEECFRVLAGMVRCNQLPNQFAMAATLASAGAARCLHHGRQVHALSMKTSFDSDVFVANALITMYSNCTGEPRMTCEDESWLVFRTLPQRNVVTWNVMISGFFRNGQLRHSLELFVEMHQDGVGFDRATLVCVLPSCATLYDCRQLHCLMIKSCCDSEVEVATALVKAYSVLGGAIEECYRAFKEVKDPDIVSWTGIMTTLAVHDAEEALSIFCQLREEGLKPDRYTFSTLVKACASFATERHCSAAHSLLLKHGFGGDLVLSNVLIHAYARCGSIRLAECVFDEMVVHDQVSWNSLIKAYATHGRGREALRAFAHMDVAPDSATFVGVLTACSHGGLVDEGRNLFETMSLTHGIAPQLDHYACMVDILGRAGNLTEAEDLVDQMPVEPDAVVWSALLGACRKHGECKIGEKAAKKLLELDPKNSVGYVMMSNIYCDTGSLHSAAFVKREMKEFGVKKEPGLSWIEIGNSIHEFSVGARYHPHREEIYVELKRLLGKLKEMGYVASTRLVLHETEDEHKEERLLNHSEKLALVFGLMNASSTQADLRIMKNIRICEDCHNFMKLASKCVEREIVVRDASRFHHFIDGDCSCGDYW